jgi:hypothetical protein
MVATAMASGQAKPAQIAAKVARFIINTSYAPRRHGGRSPPAVGFAGSIATTYGRQGPAQRPARTIRTRLHNGRMEEIFQTGLHEFITEFVSTTPRSAPPSAPNFDVS